MNSSVSIIKCNSYKSEELLSSLRQSIDLLGGISNFIKGSDKVLVKPNLLSATTPDTAIDTHPEFVRAVIRIIKQTGAQIYVGDSPSVWGTPQDVDEVYEKAGIKEVASSENVNLVKFHKARIKEDYPFTTWIDDCNKIVNLPKFKTHDLTTLTGAVKNLFGLIPGLHKTELHKRAMPGEDFSKILVDIYEIVRPTLSIVDGIVAMEADGPAHGGKPRNLGLIIAGSDAVAVDSIIAMIMGLKADDIATTKEAGKRGLGATKLDDIDIKGEKIQDVVVFDYILPQVSLLNRIPKPFLAPAKGLLRFRIQVDHSKCVRCGLCVKGCPAEAIRLKNNKIIINHKKCVLCMCCKEICPEGAVKINKSFMARMAGI